MKRRYELRWSKVVLTVKVTVIRTINRKTKTLTCVTPSRQRRLCELPAMNWQEDEKNGGSKVQRAITNN